MKGLNSPFKRNKSFSHLKHFNPNLLFLQRTLLKVSDHQCIQKHWTSHIFHSNFVGKSRGVAILISKNKKCSPSDIIADPNWRYLIIDVCITLYSTNVVLTNVYVQNTDDHFISKVFTLLPDLNNHYQILGGDFNCCLNTKIDRSSTRPASRLHTAETLQAHLDDLGLAFFILMHINTLFSPGHHFFSRSDYVLLINNYCHVFLSLTMVLLFWIMQPY